MTPQQSAKPTAGSAAGRHASVALASMATTLSMPAGAAIVGVADLEHVIRAGESYSLPGLPQLEFSANRSVCIDKSCASQEPSRGLYTHWGWLDFPAKSTPLSGGHFGLGVSAGDVIGPGGFIPSVTVIEENLSGLEDAYVGISFFEADKTYFGWVNLSTPDGAGPEFVIHGFGYNDEAGASIRAGQTTDIAEPGTLALLAAGAVGVVAGSARRRRDRA